MLGVSVLSVFGLGCAGLLSAVCRSGSFSLMLVFWSGSLSLLALLSGARVVFASVVGLGLGEGLGEGLCVGFGVVSVKHIYQQYKTMLNLLI